MNTGQIISGAGHLALIGWVVFGGSLRPDAPEMEVVEAVTISSEEYAAILSRQSAREAGAGIDTPTPPAESTAPPALAPRAEPAPDTSRPEASATPLPDAPPSTPDRVTPPPADVPDTPPTLAPPAEEMAALVPDTSPRPEPRPAPRIAPEPAAPPAPETRVDDTVREEVTPETGTEPDRPPQDATAPEEAATETVPDGVESAAPRTAIRPQARPERSTNTAEAPPDPAPTPPATDRAAIEQALAAALGQATPAPVRDAGPPLTPGELDGLRVAVQRCWNLGGLGSEALATTVTVAVRLTRAGTPEIDSIRKLSHNGGDDAAARQAYEAARRAIIRCGADGFDLPVEKYAQWKQVEITFDPSDMRVR